MASIWYYHNSLHKLAIFLIHGGGYNKRFVRISNMIGKKKSVLDLGCGTCILSKFLDRTNFYEGWDLNENFVDYNKKRGINVKLKDCFEYKGRPKFDYIVLSDILHHLSIKKRDILLRNCIIHAKEKVIVIEPFIDKKHKIYWSLVRLRKLSGIEKIFGDYDGINKEQDSYIILDKSNLIRFLKRYGKFKFYEEGKSLIAIY